jgi:hypothetical protein
MSQLEHWLVQNIFHTVSQFIGSSLERVEKSSLGLAIERLEFVW